MKISSCLVAGLLVAASALAGPAHAQDETSNPKAEGGWLQALGSPDITLRTGVVLPVFLIYELPGPLLGLTLEWPTSEHVHVVARAELGATFFDGSQRYLGKLGAGARLTPWPGALVSPWVQLGLGTTGYVERIGVVLPERVASATDVGVLLTADAAIGARFGRRWEIGLSWDHIIWPLPYYEVYSGAESLPNRGTAVLWLGMAL